MVFRPQLHYFHKSSHPHPLLVLIVERRLHWQRVCFTLCQYVSECSEAKHYKAILRRQRWNFRATAGTERKPGLLRLVFTPLLRL